MMVEDLVARALSALKARDFNSARACINTFAQTHTLELQHFLIRGLAELALEDWPAAYQTFEAATDRFPHQPQLWFNRGCAEENLGRLNEASDSYRHAIDLDPKLAEAYGNLSNIFRIQGAYKDAEAMARKALELGAPRGQTLNALGLALARQGLLGSAEEVFREALSAEPGNPMVSVNLANCAVDRLDFETAWTFFKAARDKSDDPQIRHEEGMARLLASDFARGWPLYEARLDRPRALRLRPDGPMWRGEDLAGRSVLLIAEQGFGDTIQFCRYGSVLADRGAALVWLVQGPLKRLLKNNVPGEVLAEGETPRAFDYWAPLLSLPLLTGMKSPTEAPSAPYLDAPEDGPVLPGKKKKPRIGLVWAGSATHDRALERSMTLEMFDPLLKDPVPQFFAPFTGPALKEIGSRPVQRLDDLIGDFADTACLMKSLDGLITVDTAAAHLAGALGVKTYLLLPFCPDWRWGTRGSTSPFYPSLTLIRQPVSGDWAACIDELKKILALDV